MQRIQKIMANSGVASRRKCEELIEKGLVKVNGKLAKLGDKAELKDKITVRGRLIKSEKKVYIIINKPKGIISSVGDYRGRKSVVELVKCKEKIFPVGRLDMDSEGLMILTNDGDIANRIIHPSFNVKKTYLVTLNKILSNKDVTRLKQGVSVDSKKVEVYNLNTNDKKVTLSIHEGRKHIMKNLFGVLSYKVENLVRISIGKLKLNLGSGEYKFVSLQWLKKNIF